MSVKELSYDAVIEWIDHYERGNEIPDEVMVQLMFMAQQRAISRLLAQEITNHKGTT